MPWRAATIPQRRRAARRARITRHLRSESIFPRAPHPARPHLRRTGAHPRAAASRPSPRRLLPRDRALAHRSTPSPRSSRRVPMSHHGTPTKGAGGRPLIVLQCDKCNKVLSDSSALVFSDERRDVICVKAASHIDVDEKVRARSNPRASSVPSRRVPNPVPPPRTSSRRLTSPLVHPDDEPLRTP